MPSTAWTVRELAERHTLQLLPEASSQAGAVVRGVSLDSRRIGPGMLYAALPGGSTHGARFVAQAATAGAVAVLTDPAGADIALARPGRDRPPLLVCDHPRRQLGPIAADLSGHPSHDLALVGVTGTNGKTTVSAMVDELLRSAGVRTGLIGTIRSRIADEELASSFTTPEAPDLHHLLARMVAAGCRAATTEVSSHALAQHRVDGSRFALVVFTNLSRDHLDFHGTIEDYFAAKARLFTAGFASLAVVGVDDTWGARVAGLARGAGLHVVTVGAAATGADVTVEVTEVRSSGAQVVELTGLDATPVRFGLGMPGGFNATNAALALTSVHLLLSPPPGTGDSAGGSPLPVLSGDRPVTVRELADRFTALPGVPGRMERVVPPGPAEQAGLPLVVVDYAHTPDAVAGAVAALRGATPGRLVVVLGAGGDRDQGKRLDMGRAASGADLVVVTDDNPRTEDPAAIRAAVLAGVTAESVEVGDRARAVEVALQACHGPDDTVLLAGKGHETGQSVAGTTHPFDDRAVARAALQAWAAGRGRAER